jgi:CheY-like chemotaxis protein
MAERDKEPLTTAGPARAPVSLGAPHVAFGADPAAQDRWAQKMEALGRFAPGVAHEVNNQVTLILLRTAAMLERGGEAGASRAEVEELHRAAQRVAGLMRQWQLLGRRAAPAPRRTDLNALLGEMTTMIGVALGDGIRVEADFSASPAWVLADRGGLEHVILNLALNARDALAGSGTLTLRTGNEELCGPAGEYLLPFVPGPHVLLEVRDSGCGMDRATRARIFEPYFTTKEPGKGTGLGLHNVREIVRESGGTLKVTSAPGRGAAFTVYLPQAREGAAAPGKEAVLVVEDEDSVRALLREVLGRQGYTVLEACDGRAALAVASAFASPIHLLITDCVLPYVTGTELARRLRGRFPGLKVLYVSGYSPAEAEFPDYVDPGTAFLEKPFTPAALTALARELLSSRS